MCVRQTLAYIHIHCEAKSRTLTGGINELGEQLYQCDAWYILVYTGTYWCPHSIHNRCHPWSVLEVVS